MSEEIQFTSDITVRLIQKMGGDWAVAAAAKVLLEDEEFAALRAEGSPDKLIRFLIRHRHATPVEHAALTFGVQGPIFIFREWHRHRTMSYNEESGRYRKLKPLFWVPRRDRPLVPVDGYKSTQPQFQRLESDETFAAVLESMKLSYTLSYRRYEHLLGLGIGKEVARAVLPVGIYSSMWCTTNPRNLINFLSLRTHEPTATMVSYPQAEIEEAARACEEIFKTGWPVTWKVWNEFGRTPL